MHVVAAPDKLRGSATATEVVAAVERAATAAGWNFTGCPVADGGEGTLEAFGGPNRKTMVTGPLGHPVEAPWRLDGRRAVVEMARASGLELVGAPEDNDPIGASTAGTGELVSEALLQGARRILVACGGSATTDGGLAALRAMSPLQRFRGVDLEVLCDVRTPFVNAAEVFAPQKGASAAQVKLLRRRLDLLADVYLDEHGVDVRTLPGAGAAGGLAGGLAAAGATLLDGFDVIADELGIDEMVEGADLVVTAEGFLDEQSFEGKVVGGVTDLAVTLGVPALVIVGEVLTGLEAPTCGLEVVSLVERFGWERSTSDPAGCIEETVRTALTVRQSSET